MTDGALRMRVFAFIALVLFGGLVARLWYLQGLEAQREELQQRAQTNVLEEVYEEAPRGRILDRNGRVIVDNKVVEVVTIDRGIVDDLDPVQRDEMFLRLAIAISRSGRLTRSETSSTNTATVPTVRSSGYPSQSTSTPSCSCFLANAKISFPA